MRWTPLTREDLEALMADGLEPMDDTVAAAWMAMRIEPEKWQCPPWGDAGGGFWVVAEKDGHVVWYNDVEDGFNVSPFTTRGVIAEYSCSQLSFGEVLLGLPEAKEAENWSTTPTGAIVPAELQEGGAILHRRTTYWDLRARDGSTWRLRFKKDTEARFVALHFGTLQVTDAHVMLAQYREPWLQLFFTGAPKDPRGLKRALADLTAAHSEGWRSLEEYLGGNADLAGGYGLLMYAPRSLVRKAGGRCGLPNHDGALGDSWALPHGATGAYIPRATTPPKQGPRRKCDSSSSVHRSPLR